MIELNRQEVGYIINKFMNILDNIKRIERMDQSNMIGSIDSFYKQIEQAWSETKKVKLGGSFNKIDKVVINGMGGSGLGAHIIQSVFFKKLKVPVGNIHSYQVPGMVDKNTLFILSSYSGNTEEVLFSRKEAKKRGSQILGISTGGRLGELIKNGEVAGYLIDERHNPCGEPRMGISYSVTGLLGLLRQAGVVNVSDNEIKSVILFLKKVKKKFDIRRLASANIAKQIALDLKDKIPVIITADFLSGNAHVMTNQINENAKNFSFYYVVSELNHHLMEGLKKPGTNSKNLKFVFFDSSLYYEKNRKRIEITKDVVRKNKIGYIGVELEGMTQLEQSFEMLLIGSYVSFYLAILNGVDPSPIPWVDYFKERLGK